MGLKLKSTNRKFVVGRGVMDIPLGLIGKMLPAIQAFASNKDLATNIGKSAVDLITTAKNIKDIATPKKLQ